MTTDDPTTPQVLEECRKTLAEIQRQKEKRGPVVTVHTKNEDEIRKKLKNKSEMEIVDMLRRRPSPLEAGLEAAASKLLHLCEPATATTTKKKTPTKKKKEVAEENSDLDDDSDVA